MSSTIQRRRAFATEPIMIRRLHAYREARDNAKDGLDVSRDHKLLDEWTCEEPVGIEGAMAYLDLVIDHRWRYGVSVEGCRHADPG